MKHRSYFLLIIPVSALVLAVTLGTKLGPKVWEWASLKTVESDTGVVVNSFRVPWEEDISGLAPGMITRDGHEMFTVWRWGPYKGKKHGRYVVRFPNSEIISAEGNYHKGKKIGVWTLWDPTGRIRQQHRLLKGEPIEQRFRGPWLEGVTDQTEPTAASWEGDKQ